MDHILEIRQATKKFGGLTANENVTFDVDRNTIVGIVGPNGAGKTTLFNSISGVHSLTSGDVIFEGRDITKMKPYDICHLGMGRTFQIPLSLNVRCHESSQSCAPSDSRLYRGWSQQRHCSRHPA